MGPHSHYQQQSEMSLFKPVFGLSGDTNLLVWCSSTAIVAIDSLAEASAVLLAASLAERLSGTGALVDEVLRGRPLLRTADALDSSGVNSPVVTSVTSSEPSSDSSDCSTGTSGGMVVDPDA